MADVVYRTGTVNPRGKAIDWSAIWAGLFTFAAIWSVFGFLGYAIFSGSMRGLSLGLSIWAIFLTLIAMYVAGRQTGRVAALDARSEGVAHGMIVFGLSVVAASILTVSGSVLFAGLSGGAATTVIRHPYALSAFGGSGWAAFVALFFGWIAAMVGAASETVPRAAVPAAVPSVRTAA